MILFFKCGVFLCFPSGEKSTSDAANSSQVKKESWCFFFFLLLKAQSSYPPLLPVLKNTAISCEAINSFKLHNYTNRKLLKPISPLWFYSYALKRSKACNYRQDTWSIKWSAYTRRQIFILLPCEIKTQQLSPNMLLYIAIRFTGLKCLIAWH